MVEDTGAQQKYGWRQEQKRYNINKLRDRVTELEERNRALDEELSIVWTWLRHRKIAQLAEDEIRAQRLKTKGVIKSSSVAQSRRTVNNVQSAGRFYAENPKAKWENR